MEDVVLNMHDSVKQGAESPWDGKLRLAAKVHYSFMTRSYRDQDFDIDVALKPLDLIGGDYCSINVREDGRILLCMCDVVGHDIVSALLSSRINTLAMMSDIAGGDPCALLESINGFLCDNLGDSGIYASMFCVLIDRATMSFSYAGAAHPPILHFSASDGSVTALESEATLVGFESPLPVACVVNQCEIGPGDRLLLYTDGLVEAKNCLGEQFGVESVERLLVRHQDLDCQAFNAQLMNSLKAFCGGQCDDDVLVMTLCRQ